MSNETYKTSLVLNNDYGLYSYFSERADFIYHKAIDKDEAINELSNEIEAYIESLINDIQFNPLLIELLTDAKSNINFEEIASEFINEIDEV